VGDWITPEQLIALGLTGVFLAAFLAGSIVAFPSEVVVVAAVLGMAAPAPGVVAVATAGNVLGAVTLFAIGRGSGRWAQGRLSRHIAERTTPARLEKARAQINRWGAPALLLSWVPVVGDALVLAAGVFRLRWAVFFLYVPVGKAARYAAVVWSALALAQHA
jgi:membrane protein YqaA with SNARE-associated domain